jgi:transcriptional regulator with XRE-family HTH domain
MVNWIIRSKLRVMADDLKISLALKVRAARQRLQLTQEELAELVGRTPESISNIERSQQLPSLDTLTDLARVLQIPIVEFFEEVTVPAGSSPERAKLEARLREIARSLSDRDLQIAVQQANAFLTIDA